jgi:hypothetical protein
VVGAGAFGPVEVGGQALENLLEVSEGVVRPDDLQALGERDTGPQRLGVLRKVGGERDP